MRVTTEHTTGNTGEHANLWATFLIVYLLVFAGGLISALVDLWPLVHTKSTASGNVEFFWGLFSISVTPDTGLIVMAAVVGALGAFLHASASLGDYLGNKRFVASWTPWYVVRLPLGAALAVLFYFVVRAGFLSSDASSDKVNTFGVAALAGLAGLFSKQATDKLREVFETLFRVSPQGGDAERGNSLANPVPVISALDPASVKVGATNVSLRVSGEDFVEHSIVRVGGVEQPTTFESAGELRAQLPADLVAAPAVLDVTVSSPEPGGGVSAPMTLKVEA
jgi:hypothetical protein